MNRIKDLRTEMEMKQADLASLLSVGQQAVSKYETGVLDLDTRTIARLCEIFAVTADYLLGFSSQRTARISDDDAALLDAYHNADDYAREIVDLALRPFLKTGTSSASSAAAGGNGE